MTLKIQLLNFFLETKRFKHAYESAIKFELRHLFYNDLRWYDCLANVFQVYISQICLKYILYVNKLIKLSVLGLWKPRAGI